MPSRLRFPGSLIGPSALVPTILLAFGARIAIAQTPACDLHNSARLIHGGGNLIQDMCFDSGSQSPAGGVPLVSTVNVFSDAPIGISRGDWAIESGYGWVAMHGSMSGSIIQAGNGVFCSMGECHGNRAKFTDTITINSATIPFGSPVLVRQVARLTGQFVLSEQAAGHYASFEGVGINNGSFQIIGPGIDSRDFMVAVGIPHSVSGQINCEVSSGILTSGVLTSQSYSADFRGSFSLEVLTPGASMTSSSGASYAPCSNLSIVSGPGSTSTCPGGAATLEVATSGPGPVAYQWRKNGSPISRTLNPSAGTAILTLTNIAAAAAGIYDCIVTSACGDLTSGPATLTVCPADIDCNGGVDINDLLSFLVQFEAGDAAVDLDNGSGTGTPDGGVDINDLLFFLVHFEAGC